MKVALILTISALSVIFASGAWAEEVLLEGFEGESYWSAVDWENTGQVNLEVAPESASQGKRSLKVVVREEATEWKNKVAFFKETGGIDMSKDNAVLMDVYNKEAAGIEVAIGFRTGEGWVYYESEKKQAGKGWTRDISFDLDSPDYKCKASDWKYSVPLAGRENVGEFYVLVYRPVRMAKDTVYIDNIRVK